MKYPTFISLKSYVSNVIRGFGTLPKGLPQQALACKGTSKISNAGTAENRDFFYGKGTPFLCLLFFLSLNLYNNGNLPFAKEHKEKTLQFYNCNVYSYINYFIFAEMI